MGSGDEQRLERVGEGELYHSLPHLSSTSVVANGCSTKVCVDLMILLFYFLSDFDKLPDNAVTSLLAALGWFYCPSIYIIKRKTNINK